MEQYKFNKQMKESTLHDILNFRTGDLISHNLLPRSKACSSLYKENKMNPLCKKYGHNYKEIKNEWTPWDTVLVYKICKRCDNRIDEQIIIPRDEYTKGPILLRKEENENAKN